MKGLRLGMVFVAGVLGGCAGSTVRPTPAGDLAIMHVRLIDGTGAPPIEDAVVVLDGERILAAGPAVSTPIPADAQVLDWGGRTVMPGLISDHSHVGLVADGEVAPRNYRRDVIQQALVQYERYGVTTVMALGLNRPLFIDLREEQHRGHTPGADLFGVVQGIGVPNGGPPDAMIHAAPDQLFRPDSVEAARSAVQSMAQQHTDLVKLWLDNFGGDVPAKMRPEILQAVVEEAHRDGLRVAAHIHDLVDARAAVQAGVDILAHGVRDQLVDDGFIRLLKQRETWYIPTLALDDATFAYADGASWTQAEAIQRGLPPRLRTQMRDEKWRQHVLTDPKTSAARASLEINLANLKKLYAAGVHVGFGTDSGATPLRVPGVAEQRELQLMVLAGLTPLQAITVATGQAASLLGLTDRGTLEVGKRADLWAVDGDPTRDIAQTERIVAVWRGGQPVPLSDANRGH